MILQTKIIKKIRGGGLHSATEISRGLLDISCLPNISLGHAKRAKELGSMLIFMTLFITTLPQVWGVFLL